MIFTAPATPGSYPCQWQMKRQPGSAFGEMLNLTIEVTDTTTKMLDATVVSHTIPSAMCAGETRSIAVTMRNTGSTTVWYKPDFELFAQNSPEPDDQWITSYASLNSDEDIRPGSTKTFTLAITAPVIPGSYNCNWQMNISTVDDTRLFGEKLEAVVAVVGEGESCDDGNECTGNGYCSGGVCAGATPADDGTACDIANPCTTFTCSGGLCGGTINQGTPCDDGNTCTANDTCSTEGICSGILMDCSGLDGACILGICNPYNLPPSCEQDFTRKNYASCDDAVFCNGPDSCLAGTCELHDGDPCTDDYYFCNGTESCDEGNDQCVSSGDPCAAGTACNEEIDTCFIVPCFVDGDCDDGNYCNGIETCDAGTCMTGTPVVCPDDGLFCTGAESCDEATDSCTSGGDPCGEGTMCNEEIDFCFVTLCTVDNDCDDGNYCTGVETCDAGTCMTGTPVACNDGIDCTVDSCDEATDSCAYTHNNEFCNDGLFCNGNEACDPASGCRPGTPVACPDDGLFCTGAESCDEGMDSCASSGNPCGEGTVCNDDTDSCYAVECVVNADCDDGIYCSGIETCDAGTCIPGTTVDCNDGVDCTIDSCNEAADNCDHIPDNAVCEDGQFCDGHAVCDPVNGCRPGTPVDCPDDGLFCNGTESCNEITDSCASSGNPCAGGTMCNEGTDTCDEIECSLDADCDDGIYCNGVETCDVYTCVPGTPVDCNDSVACTIDSCDEANDTCSHTPDQGLCNDGQFCNGLEVCDPVIGCQAGTPVDCPDDGLFCTGAEACSEATDSCVSGGNPCTGGTTCNESQDRCISASTTTTTVPTTTTTVPTTTTIPVTTTTIPIGACSVVISPDSQIVASGGTFAFTAVSTCDGAVVGGTYVWEIAPASAIGSGIAENTGLFTAGSTGADVTEIIQVTDITHNTIDTAEAVVTPIQPVCETVIDPPSAIVDSEESMTFIASTEGTGCLEPDYAWQIESDLNSQINAAGESCYYQAGTNKTGMLHTDSLTVVDRANNTSAEAAVTVYYGRIKRVFPKVLFGSRWIPLTHIIYIIGEDTGFNRSSQPVFTPGDSITTIGKIGFRNFMAVLLLITPNAEQELIDLAVPMVNEEGQDVSFTKADMLSLKLLPFALDEKENKPK
jgi:hypothetical protein